MATSNTQVLELKPPSTTITIGDFYRGQSIFITGASGFMGRVLIEKLLWSCEDINNLYLLVRPKKGLSVNQRIEDLLKSQEYERVRQRDPSIFKKIIPIAGDVSKPNLDISDDDRKLLESKVSIVFHVASSVRFDDPLHKAIFTNLRGTNCVMDLASNMKHLKVVVYMSTAFCNINEEIVEEKIYLSNFNWRDMIKIIEKCDEKTIDILTKKIVDKYRNTYAYSKFLAENSVNEYSKNIPCVVYRPSLVTCSINEPTPGWMYGLHGPTGPFAGIISGSFHCLYGDGDIVQDCIPCDLAINGMLVAAWYKSVSGLKECLVVNAASRGSMNLPSHVLYKKSIKYAEIYPPNNMLWYPFIVMTKNRFLYLMTVLFTHIIPAILLDSLQPFTKSKIRLLQLYRRAFAVNEISSQFMLKQVNFVTRNFNDLPNFLTLNDTKTFFFNVKEVDQNKAILDCVIGIKKFILKDDMSKDIQMIACKKFKRLYWYHKMLQTFLILLFLVIGWNILLKHFVSNTLNQWM